MELERRDGDVVPVDDQQIITRTRGRLVPQPDTPMLQCPTNLDVRTIAGRAMVFKGTSPGDLNHILREKGEIRMRVTCYLCFHDQTVDEDSGEISGYTRTVLYDCDGQTLRLSGDHIPHRVAAMTDLFSPQEWEGGLEIVVKVRRSARGRDYHDIRMVE